MCGHVGIAGKLETKDEATMKRLFMYDYFRGPDSTGLAAVRSNGTDVVISKIASHPLDLFDTTKFKTTLNGFNSRAFIGHNRAATKGVVNAVNAHPYEFGSIIGAHNGTLDRMSWNRLEDAAGEKFDVDSQAIFAAMEKIGPEETIKLMEQGKDTHAGAWALVWYDTSDKKLRFIRNKWRTFWIAYTKNFDRVFWASEWPFIRLATELSAQGYELYQDKEGHSFFSTKEDWLYEYDLDELVKGATERPKPRVMEIKGREPTPVIAAGGAPFQRPTNCGGTTTSHGPNGTVMGAGTPTNQSPTQTPPKRRGDVIQMSANNIRPYTARISRGEFEEISKYGCSFCQRDIEYGDLGVAIYEKEQMILCSNCNVDEDSTRIYIQNFDQVAETAS